MRHFKEGEPRELKEGEDPWAKNPPPKPMEIDRDMFRLAGEVYGEMRVMLPTGHLTMHYDDEKMFVFTYSYEVGGVEQRLKMAEDAFKRPASPAMVHVIARNNAYAIDRELSKKVGE